MPDPPDTIAELLFTQGWMLVLGLFVLSILVWRGVLRPSALANGSDRQDLVEPSDLCVAFGLALLGPLAAGLFVLTIFPFDSELADPSASLTLRQTALATLLAQLAGLGPAALYLPLRLALSRTDPWAKLARLGLTARRPLHQLGAVGLALLCLPLVFSVGVAAQLVGMLIGSPLHIVGHEMLLRMLSADDEVALGVMIASAVLVAPLVEELVYRGLFQTALQRALGPRRWLVIFLAAGLFGLIHINAVMNWQQIAPLVAFGVMLGYLYERTGSLWPGILVHALFNVLNILAAFAMAPPSSG